MTLSEEEAQSLREEMVRRQLESRDIADPLVLEAMRTVPRHLFVGEDQQGAAYTDRPLPIAEGQTISQPYIVALMVQVARLKPGDRVLEVGAGSGYAAAVAAQIAGHVYAIERHARLTEDARRSLERADVRNVTLRTGDGTLGWAEEAPFDAILVAAGAPVAPQSLKRQLAEGGRLVIPVLAGGDERKGLSAWLGPVDYQDLVCIRRMPDGSFDEERHGAVRFVPLIGAEGYSGRKADG